MRHCRAVALLAVLPMLLCAARATPVITMVMPVSRLALDARTVGSYFELATMADASAFSALAFQSLTPGQNGSFRPQGQERSIGNDANVNALVGLNNTGNLPHSTSSGASVFVGSSAALERGSLPTSDVVRSPASRQGQETPKTADNVHASTISQTEIRRLLPGASVFVGSAPGALATAGAGFGIQSRPLESRRASSVASPDQDLSKALRDQIADNGLQGFNPTTEMFSVGALTVSIPIAAVGVVGALGSTLAALVGTPAATDDSMDPLQ